MAKIRKRPKPADDKPAAAVDVELVPEPAQPPPVVEYRPPVASTGLLPCVRSPEDVIHNVIERQLRDDLDEPPQIEPKDEALELWFKVIAAKDAGKPLEPFAEDIARVTHGNDTELKLAQALYTRIRIRRFFRQVESDEVIERFLHRCMRRGDLTAREALVFKQNNLAEMRETLKDIIHNNDAEPVAFIPEEDLVKMDWSLQMVEKTTSKTMCQTTPQEREIIRKITLKARRMMFKPHLK